MKLKFAKSVLVVIGMMMYSCAFCPVASGKFTEREMAGNRVKILPGFIADSKKKIAENDLKIAENIAVENKFINSSIKELRIKFKNIINTAQNVLDDLALENPTILMNSNTAAATTTGGDWTFGSIKGNGGDGVNKAKKQ